MSTPKLLITKGQELTEISHRGGDFARIGKKELISDRYFGNRYLFEISYYTVYYQTRYFIYNNKPYALIVRIEDPDRFRYRISSNTKDPTIIDYKALDKMRRRLKYRVEGEPGPQYQVRKFYSLSALDKYRKDKIWCLR